jgi:CheY-like chemotaxis protein
MTATSKRPILLVEDSPMDLDLSLRALSARKIANEIVVARDGEEALGQIARWDAGAPPPVVVLLDLRLPRLSGLEVLRHLKEHPRYSAIPVVVLTTSRDDTDVREAYALGANSYIVKPVEFEKFVEVAHQIDLYWCLLNHSDPLDAPAT